jgi:hypothetical protein
VWCRRGRVRLYTAIWRREVVLSEDAEGCGTLPWGWGVACQVIQDLSTAPLLPVGDPRREMEAAIEECTPAHCTTWSEYERIEQLSGESHSATEERNCHMQ